MCGGYSKERQRAGSSVEDPAWRADPKLRHLRAG